jgi:hypothetical protein
VPPTSSTARSDCPFRCYSSSTFGELT